MRTALKACAVATTLVCCVAVAVADAASESGEARVRGAEAEVGVLDVSSEPPARITIDEKETGKVTPQPHLELSAGHHSLKLETLDKAHKRTIGFTIHKGETTKLTLHLAS